MIKILLSYPHFYVIDPPTDSLSLSCVNPPFWMCLCFCACAVGLAPGRVGSVEAYGSAGRPPQASGLVGCLVLTLCVPGPLADYTPHTADGINTHTRYNSNPMVSGGGGTRTPSLAKTRLQTQCLVTQPCETTLPVSQRSLFTHTSKWLILLRI